MKASDLRIGNWIMRKYMIVQVYTINKDYPFDDSDSTGYINGADNSDGISPEHEGIFKPIPLNEEWLLKFGFMSDNLLDEDRTPILTIDCGEHVIDFIVGYYDECEVDDLKTPCKYVHKLQNLYFALTGEELTIK